MNTSRGHTGRRERLVAATAWLIVTLVTLALAEILVRWVAPQRSLYPRTQYSQDYGFLPYPDTQMVNEVPGRWRFVYSTNSQGHRGALLPISNRYEQPTVVLLGDSYTFGVGVDDGQEYAQRLRKQLQGSHDVVNLGVEGWGLTQEIRRYYELGQLYQPSVVVLQFCSNDPADNLLNPVTTIEHGRFAFRPTSSSLETVKRYLSQSWLQKSQLYNLVRNLGYNMWRGREVQQQMRAVAPNQARATVADASAAPAVDEAYYMQLLDLFAADLRRRGVRLVMFAVDGQLDRFPALRAQVQALQEQGLLQYEELMDWFVDGKIELSPEGHWAPAVHEVIAGHLARAIVAAPGVAAPGAATR